MVNQEAIVVRNARKRYGTTVILDGFNLSVSRGSIYGLLGASGCGKTTLLSCVVGVRQLDSGEIWVLGGKPGSQGSGIPGPKVGYMPQDISLVKEFSVIGALYYFGRINGLEDYVIDEKYTQFADLLQLPPRNRLIKHMSGGQQRRVSFAAALLHKPELLILDEPTVGLDPILRENIWQYLVKLTVEEGTAVVITTHYIEETRLANKIGLMRCGQLLAECSPDELLANFQCNTLEEAFLILSQKQKENQQHGIMGNTTGYLSEMEELDSIQDRCANPKETNEKFYSNQERGMKNEWNRVSNRKKYKALMAKNFLQFLRHPGGILFALVLPLVQVTCFFNAVGPDPKGLKIAVVNEEAGHCNYSNYAGSVFYDPENYTCDYIDLSCRFLKGFNDSIAEKVYFDTLEETNEPSKTGKVVGVMFFSHNFSAALQARQDDFRFASVEDIVAGQIQVWLDMGNRQIGLYMQKRLHDRFFELYRDIVRDCQISPKFADLPVKFEDPVFGTMQQNYATFVAPGFLLTVVFLVCTTVSSSIIITDRHEGVWDRTLVQGVTTGQILFAHLLTQLSVIVLQVTVSLCVTFLQYDLGCKGSMAVVIALVMLNGFCGMCYGFMISVMCTSHTMANYASTGTFYPLILLCGCIWPVEGMPKFLRFFSYMLPTTVPSISLRNILDKGFSINDSQVYSGFLVLFAWIAVLLLMCFLRLRFKDA